MDWNGTKPAGKLTQVALTDGGGVTTVPFRAVKTSRPATVELIRCWLSARGPPFKKLPGVRQPGSSNVVFEPLVYPTHAELPPRPPSPPLASPVSHMTES